MAAFDSILLDAAYFLSCKGECLNNKVLSFSLQLIDNQLFVSLSFIIYRSSFFLETINK
jgi:hypothetical protein